jgi:hypothetical protein
VLVVIARMMLIAFCTPSWSVPLTNAAVLVGVDLGAGAGADLLDVLAVDRSWPIWSTSICSISSSGRTH